MNLDGDEWFRRSKRRALPTRIAPPGTPTSPGHRDPQRTTMINLGATSCTSTHPMSIKLLEASRETAALPKLRLCISGGASLPVPVLERFNEAFDTVVFVGYGLSEAIAHRSRQPAGLRHSRRNRRPRPLGIGRRDRLRRPRRAYRAPAGRRDRDPRPQPLLRIPRPLRGDHGGPH
ncbi:AMP-binding protein [Streptomyces sp. NPDC046900]|uniref:AMP-binding protein n=1 Tax=Streptomyces sp. NPDC046900 TaxID=3155473 RepID=UPI0033C8C997